MESGQRQSLSPGKSPDKPDRPESPLTGLEFDMSRLSLEAENEGLKEKVHELQTELQDEKSHEQYLRREQLVEAKQIREEERKHAQAMVSEVRRKLYKEKQQEVHELRERLLKEKEKEITYIIKQKDEEFRKAQLNWHREKEDLAQKLRVQFTNEIREEAQKSHEKQIRKFEVYIEELKDQKKKLEESCKLAQDADKKKVNQIRRMHSEHEQELTKLKRSSWQEGRKQMAEIRQLTNIIHQLEKKLGVESGHYIRVQLEKDSLRDKLDRIKGNEMSGRKSPLSSSRTDLSSDLSMFSFPSVDDSNPLWLQIKQQKCTIAQLKQNIQDKNRRIDLLKQKLFKNRRFGPGGVMHRSMDDILSYESGPERDDCISPMFGYSTGSSDTSSLNEESSQSDDNQDAEIIRRLQKEILQLQKAHSLLQAQTESTVDVKRTQLEKEQLQTDLIEAQRQIDEQNKDLVESHDRNELLEFQLQESLQRNVDEGNCVLTFKIPTLCVDYKFSDKELFCSAEEVKARLEELQNEKKPVLNRDEQLTLQQAKLLLENIATVKETVPRTFSVAEDQSEGSGAVQKDFLQLPVFDDSIHNDSFLEDTDEFITTTTDLEEEFLERTRVEPAMEDNVSQQKYLEDLGIDSYESVLKESVQLYDAEVQTDFHESPGELSLKSNALEPENDFAVKKIEIAVQCDIEPQRSSNLEIDSHKGVLKESLQLCNAGVQTDFHESLGELGLKSNALEPDNDVSVQKIEIAVQCSTDIPVTEASAQCNILDIESLNGDVIIKFEDDGFDVCKFKKIMKSKDIGIQLVPGEVSYASDDGERHLPKEETSLYTKESSKDPGVDKIVQCDIIEILTHEEEIIEIFNELKTFRFKKIPISNDSAVQTDMQEYDVLDNDVIIDDISNDVMGSGVIGDDVTGDDAIGDDVMDDDVMDDDVMDNVPVVEENEVREKHDGEPSEKTLLGLGWKDFVDGSELGDDAKLLDCIVYEKEDVFVVICDSYRKYCKEISSDDYTFDCDDDNDCNEFLETCSEDQIKHPSNDIISDNTVADKFDSKCNVADESDYSEGASNDLQTLSLDSNKNVSKAFEQVSVTLKTVEEGYIEKCEIGIQCDKQEGECITDVGEKFDICPHCMKPLSASPGNEMFLINDARENRSFPGGADGSMLYSQLSEDGTGIDGEDELDLIDEPLPQDIDFGFREMCDFGVQCVLNDGIDLSLKDVLCLCCGHSTSLCSDIGIQCEFADILSSDLQDGANRSSKDAPCLCCGHSGSSCSDIGIQCEFADLLSSSTGMPGEIPGALQEDEGESLIKEVMALAKECSQNDVLIDQHLSEVVREQGLFSQIQDGDDNNDDDGDQGGIPLSDEQSRGLYSEIPNSRILSQDEEIVHDFDTISEKYPHPNDEVTSEDEMPHFPWKEVRDVETQCGRDESLEREEKAVQCTLLDGGQQFGIEAILAGEDVAGDMVGVRSGHDTTFEEEDGDITAEQGEPRSRPLRISPQGSGSVEHGRESRVIARNTLSNPTLNIDLNDVFNEMEAQPSYPILNVTLTPQENPPPDVSDESPDVTRRHDGTLRSFAEEPTIIRTSKADTLHALDETLEAFAAQDEIRNDVSSARLKTKQTDNVDISRQVQSLVGVVDEGLTKRTAIHLYNEDLDSSQHGESSTTSLSDEGPERVTFENDGDSSDLEVTSSSETSSQVTVENRDPSIHDNYPPISDSYLRTHANHPPTHDNQPPTHDNQPPTYDDHPPITDHPPSGDTSFPKHDSPPPLPVTLPPTLPSVSPPGVMHNDLDDDIEALLAGELDQDTGDLTPSDVENPVGVRSTLEQEIQTILESEDSSVRSEPNTVLSMDSLYMDQTAMVSCTQPVESHTVDNSTCYENTDVFNDETEMMSSFDGDDVISDDVTSINNDDVISEGNDDVILRTDDRLLYASGDRKSRNFNDDSQRIVGKENSPVKHVVFESEISEDSTTESSSVGESAPRSQPPPVLPKPKYRSHSMNLPISGLPPVPSQSERPNSMAARKDIVDGYFPPVGLVTRRASEFNIGEFDLLKERIVYLERQLKNKENLLQSMRTEATEIETNAYIQKKEEDIKMMDESVRFLKVENQKKEKELLVKIGEINKYTFELDQLKSERVNAERQREILEDNVNSLQDRVSQLQSVQVQYQELRCKYDSLGKENTQLHEQVSRLHRADEEFVELEKTISKLQGKLKELEDVKRERDDASEQLKALKTQKDDLAQKGRKVETERNDFLMNNKLILQQKENLEARNNALQRTNDTFKTKISSLEKECRESQRKLFDVQRERDEGSSQLRKLEAERNELRKRVNELIECKSELKQYQSKSQDIERELNYLRNQCKKIDSERTELSTELGNCLKERNRLVGRTAELEKLTRDNEKLEERFHTLKLKIAELTGQRDDAEVQLPTLKAKVALLKKACKEKDDQLDKLKAEIRELKHSIASSALEDLSGIPSFGFGSPGKTVKFREPPDLNNNHVASEDCVKGKRFVVLFDYDPERLSTTGHPEKELKLNEGDVITVNSDLDLNGYYMAELDGKRGLVSSLYIEEMDEYDMRKLRKQRELNASKIPAKKPDLHSIPPRALTNIPGLVKRSFVAVKDYNPFTSSSSTRPDLELPLTAGEVVTVVGDVDANGYYTVEKGGRLAIIPSNLVKPSSPSLTRPNKLNFTPPPVQTLEQARSREETQGASRLNAFSNHPSHSSIVPRQSTVIHEAPPGSTPYASREITEQFIRQNSVENILSTENTSTAGGNRGTAEGKIMNISSALPSAPRNLRVLRCVNKDALLLGWITPQVDELGRNNGQLIKGYKILANGQPKLNVDSPYMAKALIENLDLTRPVELAIQTVADNGFCSEKSLTHFNEAVMMETTSVTTEDVSHLDNSLPYRTFVALFSYDPLKSSPNPNPTLELEFQEGDIIRVLDTSRTDGYYTGQVNGHEGLVPSNFIEEIAVALRPQHRKRDKELHGSNASLRSTSSLSPKKAKAMVALYDYNPTAQSPNKHPDRELSFRKGQIVRVLGSMRADGFYEADINGQRGLVPATFLKPCKRKSTKSVNSTNGFASLPRRVQFAHEQDSRQMTAGYV